MLKVRIKANVKCPKHPPFARRRLDQEFNKAPILVLGRPLYEPCCDSVENSSCTGCAG